MLGLDLQPKGPADLAGFCLGFCPDFELSNGKVRSPDTNVIAHLHHSLHHSPACCSTVLTRVQRSRLLYKLQSVSKHTCMSPVRSVLRSPASLDRARGAVLGALIGDAAGVPLEGLTAQRDLTESKVQEALQFPGCDRAGRYQVTSTLWCYIRTATAALS